MLSALHKKQGKVCAKVYLADILLDSKHKKTLRRGECTVVQNLKQAKVIICVKSEQPGKVTHIVGKLIDSLRKRIQDLPIVVARGVQNVAWGV